MPAFQAGGSCLLSHGLEGSAPCQGKRAIGSSFTSCTPACAGSGVLWRPGVRLATRPTLILLALSLLPVGILSYLGYDHGKAAIQQDAFDHLTLVNVLKEAELDRWVSDKEQRLRVLAGGRLFAELAAALVGTDWDHAADEASYHSLLEDHLTPTLDEVPGLLALQLLRPADGLIVVSTDQSIEGQLASNASYFLEGSTGTWYESVSSASEDREAAMYFATPVNDAGGDLVAILVARANLADLSATMQQHGEPSENEDTYLVSSFGSLVTEPVSAEAYVPEADPQTTAAASCLAGNSGVALYEGYRQVPVVGAYRWNEDAALCVITELAQAEAYAPVRSLAYGFVGVGSIVALAVAVAAVLLAQSIAGPASRLVRGAAESGGAKLDHRRIVSRKDALGQPAAALDLMAADLRRSSGGPIHGERLLLALGQAAEAARKAVTPDEVCRTVGEQLALLGYRASVFTLAEGGSHLAMPQLGFELRPLQAAEKLVGLSGDTYRFPVVPGGFYEHVITTRSTAFREPFTQPIAEALPKGVRHLAGPVASVLGIHLGMVAPLVVAGEVYGLLILHGSGLTTADIPAVTAFANQTAIALENAIASEELRKHRDSLEELASQRTAEIEKANQELEAEIAERKRAESALRALTARYEAILAAAPDIITEMNTDRVYTWTNQAGYRFFGDDMVGKEASLFFEGEQDTYDVVQPLFDGDDTVIYVESWQRRQDGEKRLLAWWNRSLANEDGEVTGILSTARDITELRKAAEDLREYSDRLEEMVDERTHELRETQDLLLRHERLAVLGQLAGGIGHELRNPLGAIKGAAYFLSMALDNPDPDVKQTLEILDREVATSDRIISTLLDFARPKATFRRKVDVNKVVRDVLSKVQIPDSIELTTRLGRGLPYVLADSEQLTQVFGNIVRNAVQAMPEGGQLRVTSWEMKGKGPASRSVAVRVKDSGTGITERDLDKVFEPLFTTKARGIGLGLALSKILVEGHGGAIEVQSREGEGSAFTVTLPLSGSA
jgi:PAS domain S-box-containing protein